MINSTLSERWVPMSGSGATSFKSVLSASVLGSGLIFKLYRATSTQPPLSSRKFQTATPSVFSSNFPNPHQTVLPSSPT